MSQVKNPDVVALEHRVADLERDMDALKSSLDIHIINAVNNLTLADLRRPRLKLVADGAHCNVVPIKEGLV